MNIHWILNRLSLLLVVTLFIVQGNLIPAVAAQPAGLPAYETKAGKSSASREQFKQPLPKQDENIFTFSPNAPDRNTIGCILPLSGSYGENGSKALDAILLALGLFDEKNGKPWKLIVEDTRALPEGSRAAVLSLTRKNVIAIIAVAGTAEAIDIVREADKYKIPVILIASKEGVTSSSNYVFQNFLTPSQQIRALTNYALDNLNCAIFSILYPKDDYGTEMVKIFRNETNRIGGKVEQAVSYSKAQTDFTEEINKITGHSSDFSKKIHAGKGEAKPPTTVDFEALFIPDSYQRVKMITSQLAFYDVRGIRLLGTSLWNSPGLLKTGAEYLEGAVFADSFFVNSFYPEVNDFVDIYYTAYSREPENLEALAYDTAKMTISVLQDVNVQTREQFIAGLQQLKNYKGVTGVTSFREDRVARKTAFILQVKNGKLEQVK